MKRWVWQGFGFYKDHYQIILTSIKMSRFAQVNAFLGRCVLRKQQMLISRFIQIAHVKMFFVVDGLKTFMMMLYSF